MRRTQAEGHKDNCVPKSRTLSGNNSQKLTDAEQDVLYLLAHEKLTINQAALRRDVEPRAVYKMRQRLIQKGVLNIVNDIVQNEGGHSTVQSVHKIRLHAEQYHVRIIWCDEKYRKRMLNIHRIMLDGQTIMLYRDVIEVYSNKSFYGIDADECDRIAARYWTHFLTRLEHSVKCILVKKESWNIERVRAEYAETLNELATTCIKEHEKVRVSGDDGKLWLIIDNSFNFNELETIHTQTSKLDMQNVAAPFFNDLRNYNKENGHTLRLSDIFLIVKEIAEQNKASASCLNSFVSIQTNHVLVPPPKSEHKIGGEVSDHLSSSPLSILKLKVNSFHDILAPENFDEFSKLFHSMSEHEHEQSFEWLRSLPGSEFH